MLNNDLKLMKLIDILKNRNLTKYFILGLSLLIAILILKKFFLLAVLIGISLVISYFIGMFQMSKSIGIELVTFTTFLAGFAFGPTTGAAIGLILITIHLIIGHFAFGPYIFWTIPLYIMLGILAGTLTGFEFVTLGIYSMLAINIISMILTAITYYQNLVNYIPFSITNIIFNLMLFLQFGPAIYSLVK